MDKHPIESIMSTTLESIRDMIDVNTIIGEAIATPDGSTVIPLSRVSFGFVAGGGDYTAGGEGGNAAGGTGNAAAAPKPDGQALPFAGGTGAGVTVQPMGFLVVNQEQIRMLPAQYYAPIDRIIDLVPQVMCEIKRLAAAEADKAAAEMPLPKS